MTGIILLFVLLHFAFALAIGYWLLMTSAKFEGWMKTLGAVFGWLIIALAGLLMLTSTIKFMIEGNNAPTNWSMQNQIPPRKPCCGQF